MLAAIWKGVTETFSGILRRRQQTWSISDDTGESIFYAPSGVDRDDWQQMIKAKLGREVVSPRDIANMHMACTITAMKLQDEGLKPSEVLAGLMAMDIVPENILPEFVSGLGSPRL